MERPITISVCGNQCTVITDQSDEHIQNIIKIVEDKINSTIKENPRISTSLAAILAAMDLCEELENLKDSMDNLRAQLKMYLDDLENTSNERDEAKRQIRLLKSEIERLKNERLG